MLADAFLLDSFDPSTGRVGGTGKTHNWQNSAKTVASVHRPAILAGGLNPDNVAEAKEWFHTRIAWIDEHIAEIDTTDIKTGIVGITEKMPTSLNVKASSLNCYDLSGRRLSVPSASSVSSVLPKGVYIEDGKKRVRK